MPSFDYSSLPMALEEGRFIFVVDLGNGTSEIGWTQNPRVAVNRYLTDEPEVKGIWLSRLHIDKRAEKTEDPDLDYFVGLELSDSEWHYMQLLEFANRAAVGKLSETRFSVLPIGCLIAFANYCNTGPGKLYIF